MTILSQDPPFEALAAALPALLRSDLLEHLLEAELDLCLHDGNHVSPYMAEDTALCLLQTGDIRLTAMLALPAFGDVVTTLGRDTALGLAGGGPVRLRRFLLEYPGDAPGSSAPRLTESSPITLARGEVHVFPATRETFLIDRIEAPVVFLSLTSALRCRFCFPFDLATGVSRRMIAADLRASRLELALDLLAELGDDEDLDAVKPLLSHPDHFVRWAATGALAALDVGAGTIALRSALSDPHPDVRDAARSTLRDLAANTPG